MSSKSKKRKKSHRKPENLSPAKPETVAETTQKAEVKYQRKSSDKPLFMRVIVLAIAAVMVLGIVISAAAGSTGGFF